MKYSCKIYCRCEIVQICKMQLVYGYRDISQQKLLAILSSCNSIPFRKKTKLQLNPVPYYLMQKHQLMNLVDRFTRFALNYPIHKLMGL